jgi:hypothetical protein
MTEDKLMVLQQVNCRSIYNKALDFWNLTDTYNPDVVRGMESWLSEEISNMDVFRADYTTFRRDRHIHSGAIKDHNVTIIRDTTEKANIFKFLLCTRLLQRS